MCAQDRAEATGGKFCSSRQDFVTRICPSDMKKALFVRNRAFFRLWLDFFYQRTARRANMGTGL